MVQVKFLWTNEFWQIFLFHINSMSKQKWLERKEGSDSYSKLHLCDDVFQSPQFNFKNSKNFSVGHDLSFELCYVLSVPCTGTVVKLEVSDGHHSDIHNLLSITHKSMAIRRRNYLILNQNPFAVSFNLYISQ